MTELIDELRPVGWLVVEFPGSRFNEFRGSRFNSEIPLLAPASINGPAPIPRTATTVATPAVVGSSMTDRFMDEIETGA